MFIYSNISVMLSSSEILVGTLTYWNQYKQTIRRPSSVPSYLYAERLYTQCSPVRYALSPCGLTLKVTFLVMHLWYQSGVASL